jgi:HprK-related kinase B
MTHRMPIETLSIDDVAAEWSSPHEMAGQLDLAIDACLIRVRSNSMALLDELRGYFSPFVVMTEQPAIVIDALEAEPPIINAELTIKQPDPGKTKIKEEFIDLADGRIVRKRLTGMVFAFGGQTNVAIGPCQANANQVVNFVNNRYIEWRLHHEATLFHAAAVVYQDRGVAVSGFSGAGKSTLSLHMMSRGADFVSNDRLMVARDGDRLRMFGVSKLPRINPGTIVNNPDLSNMLSTEEIDTFKDMNPPTLWNLEQKYDVDLERCFGVGRQLLSHRLDRLVVLNWARDDSPTEVNPIDLSCRPDLMPAFMKSVGLFFRYDGIGTMPPDDPESYVNLLRSCTVLEVRGGVDFDLAADACLTFNG